MDNYDRWMSNAIQFPRVIEEAQAAGAFTEDVIREMCQSMDLVPEELLELLERARGKWERIKELSKDELSDEDWILVYKPIQNQFVEGASFDGTMFETYGPEEEYVQNRAKDNVVWTLMDNDDGDGQVIVAGKCFVNRLGYFITEKPWDRLELNYPLDPPNYD